MKITFTRVGERDCTTEVVRDDGVTLRVPSHDRPTSLPHDLAHFIVERELGLSGGFWGCVAADAVLPGMQVVSGRQPPHALQRSRQVMREAGQQGTEAEVWVAVLVSIMRDRLDDDWPAASTRLAAEWKPRHPSRGPVTIEEVRRICAALREGQERWQALANGGSITVIWQTATRKKR